MFLHDVWTEFYLWPVSVQSTVGSPVHSRCSYSKIRQRHKAKVFPNWNFCLSDSLFMINVFMICLYVQCKDFLKAGKGVYSDLRRRLPLYPSDFTDGEMVIFICFIVIVFYFKIIPPANWLPLLSDLFDNVFVLWKSGFAVFWLFWFCCFKNHCNDPLRHNWEGSLPAEVHYHCYFPLHCHSVACYCLWLTEWRKHERRDRWASVCYILFKCCLLVSTDILSFLFCARCAEDHCWPEHWRSDLCLVCWLTTSHSTDHCTAGHLHKRCVMTSNKEIRGHRFIVFLHNRGLDL